MDVDEVPRDHLMSVKRNSFSQRVQRMGLLEIARQCRSLSAIQDIWSVNAYDAASADLWDIAYSWDVVRKGGGRGGKGKKVELKPRYIEKWLWGGDVAK